MGFRDDVKSILETSFPTVKEEVITDAANAICALNIQKAKPEWKDIELNSIKPGDRILFKGYEWVVLDPFIYPFGGDGMLVVMAKNWEHDGETEFKFNEDPCDGCNNYAKSSIRQLLQEELLPELGEDNLLPYKISLDADNGDDAYGIVEDKVFLLDMYTYRHYKKVMPKWDNWTWTCTPWYCLGQTVGNAHYVRYVNPDGSVYGSGHACNSLGVAPACVLRIGNLKSRATARGLELEEKDG